jgi:isopentenyl diphosphate isomerase/L-lactate dehydrogenase-like FMN-dependent dehydrogenase
VDANASAAGSGAIGAGSPKDAGLTWDDLPWFRSITKMRIVLKGVATAADAVLAVRAGVDGIVCSNHGGRQQDTARSGLEILAEVSPRLRRCDDGIFSAAMQPPHGLLKTS